MAEFRREEGRLPVFSFLGPGDALAAVFAVGDDWPPFLAGEEGPFLAGDWDLDPAEPESPLPSF